MGSMDQMFHLVYQVILRWICEISDLPCKVTHTPSALKIILGFKKTVHKKTLSCKIYHIFIYLILFTFYNMTLGFSIQFYFI